MPFLFVANSVAKDDSTQWVALAVGVLATCYLVMRGRAKGKRKDPFEKAATFGVSQQKQIERDISSLMVEMLETARHMTAQIDTRATRLELLMKEADAKLAALKVASAGVGVPTAAPGAGEVSAVDSVAGVATVERAVEALATKRSKDREEFDAGGGGEGADSDLRGATRGETPPDPRHGEIYSMADQGRSPQEIARSLNRPNGEVELILALRSR